MTLEEVQAIRQRWKWIKHGAPDWFHTDMERLLTWVESEQERLDASRAEGAMAMKRAAIEALAFLWDRGAANMVAGLDPKVQP